MPVREFWLTVGAWSPIESFTSPRGGSPANARTRCERSWPRSEGKANGRSIIATRSRRFSPPSWGSRRTVVQRVIGRKNYGISAMTDDVLAEQQQIADVFHSLRLIPHPIAVREAVVPDLLSELSGSADQGAGHHVAAK